MIYTDTKKNTTIRIDTSTHELWIFGDPVDFTYLYSWIKDIECRRDGWFPPYEVGPVVTHIEHSDPERLADRVFIIATYRFAWNQEWQIHGEEKVVTLTE